MAKIRDMRSTSNPKLAKVAAQMVKRGRKPLDESEKNPKSRFIRIAGMRLAKILKLSKALRSCANRDMYEYSDEQVEKVFRLIRNSIDRTEAIFNEAKASTNGATVRKISKLENPLA